MQKRFVIKQKDPQRTTDASLPAFSPERVGPPEASSSKIIQQKQEEVCKGHRTQSAAHPLAGKQRRGAKASGITQKCAVSSGRASARPRGDSAWFLQPE